MEESEMNISVKKVVAAVTAALAIGVLGCNSRTAPEVKSTRAAIEPDAFAQAPVAPDALPGGSLEPTTIPKYVDPLVIPPAMPRTAVLAPNSRKPTHYYEIAVRQFEQQVLPTGMPMTTVWSYGSLKAPGTVAQGGSFNYPAFTIEARYQHPVRVKWMNQLVKDPAACAASTMPVTDPACNYLPHLLPVDPTLHWANPPGGEAGRDSRPTFEIGTPTPGPYTGPVPIVTHLHGGITFEDSDGFPEAWYLPTANNIPADFATVGTYYNQFKSEAEARVGQPWDPGTAVFQYQNEQAATTLWYHDHSLGITRLHVYSGPAGFYLLRGGRTDLKAGVLPGPAPQLGDPPGTKYYEIPIVIQDRSFNADGSLFYPASRAFFDGFTGPYLPGTTAFRSDVSPIWNPETFGNTIVVNGKTWPFLQVEQRRYRFRFLDGSQTRFLILTTDYVDANGEPLKLCQIGADGGFLPAPECRTEILLGPAERSDTIVDFTNVPVGTNITLVNLGPDEPFGGGVPGTDFAVSDPDTTGQVMQFQVVAVDATNPDTSTPPGQLVLPAPPELPGVPTVRQVSLNELDSAFVCLDANEVPVPCTDPAAVSPFGPLEARLGTVTFERDPETGNLVPKGMDLPWDADITENPAAGATEIWEMFNFTEDAHPIHIHDVQFQIVNRETIGVPGSVRSPDPGESGRKDTVIAYPGEITRVMAHYIHTGLFVWHCHILEHEDNEMMRPYRIGP